VGLWEGRTRREGIWGGMMVDTGAGYSFFDPWIRNKFFPDPLLTGPDLEKNGMDGGSG